jgi:hypothetical protein
MTESLTTELNFGLSVIFSHAFLYRIQKVRLREQVTIDILTRMNNKRHVLTLSRPIINHETFLSNYPSFIFIGALH